MAATEGFLNETSDLSLRPGQKGRVRQQRPFGGGESALDTALATRPTIGPQVPSVDPKSAFTPPAPAPVASGAPSAASLSALGSESGAGDIPPLVDRLGPKTGGGVDFSRPSNPFESAQTPISEPATAFTPPAIPDLVAKMPGIGSAITGQRDALTQAMNAQISRGPMSQPADRAAATAAAGGDPNEVNDLTRRDGQRGVAPQAGQGDPAAPSSFEMAQLQPADPTKGWNTPYYAAYTNDGDMAAAVMVDAGKRVRLVDPGSGQVVAEGIGPEGAQQIVSLANAVSRDLGRKAQWQIQGETGDGQFTTMGGDRYDPKKPSLLKTIVRIAAPILGAAIPGLGPALGAALGGFGGTLATGGSLKESLLAGAAGGIGNVAGGALSSVFQGAPIAWGGVNPLGGILGHAGDALSGLSGSVGGMGGAGGAAGAAGGAAGGLGGLGGATGGLAGAGGAAGLLGTEVAPIIVQAAAQPGLGTALSAALASAAGGAMPNFSGQIFQGQQGNLANGADPSSNFRPLTHNAGVADFSQPLISGGTTSAASGGGATGGGTEVEGITVTGGAQPSGVPIAVTSGAGGAGGGGKEPVTGGPEGTNPSDGLPDWLKDFAGQTIGGVGADLGVYGLAGALGLLGPGGKKDTVRGGDKDSPTGDQGGGGQGPIDAGDGGSGGGPADGQQPAPKPGTTTGGNPSGGSGGGVPGTPKAQTYTSNSGPAGGPGAAAPKDGSRGSTSPDIYPWRRPEGR